MTTGSGGTRAIDELTVLVRPPLRAVAARVPEIVFGLAVLVTALAGLALIGAVVNDRVIDAHRAVAVAEVLPESTFDRTLVRFTAASGEAVVPKRGVLYPRGVETGSTVTVEYDAADPEIVRVAGRSAVDGLVPVLLIVAGTWLVLGPLAARLRRRRLARRV